MKNIMNSALIAILAILALVSCDNTINSDQSTTTSSAKSVTDYTYADSSDLPSSYTFTEGEEYTSEDSSATVSITNPDSVNYSYTLSGSFSQITVDTDTAVQLILDNVTVSSSKAALKLSGGGTVFLKLVGDSYITSTGKKGISTEDYAANNLVIYSDDSEASLSVHTYSKDAINLDGGRLRVLSGILNISVEEGEDYLGDGIDVFAYVQDGGTVTINALGQYFDEESRGIKAKGDDDSSLYSDPMGYIAINDGVLNITSYGKAMTANWDYTEDGDCELDGSNGTDPAACLYINGGTITIRTLAEPVEEGTYAADTTYSLSPEGIEAKQDLVINGGTIEVIATDDALNAGNTIEINAGSLFAYSTVCDGIDSNGTLVINGGNVVVIGAAEPETAIDCDSDSNFTYTGGTVVALGGAANNNPTASGTTGYAVTTSYSSSLAIKDSSGSYIMAFSLPDSVTTESSLSNALLASASLTKGSTYTLVSGGTVTASSVFNGLATAGISVSGGTSTSFTVSSTVTTAGSSSSQTGPSVPGDNRPGQFR